MDTVRTHERNETISRAALTPPSIHIMSYESFGPYKAPWAGPCTGPSAGKGRGLGPISRVGHILEWGIDMNVDDGIGIAIAEVHMQNCLAETMLLFWCSICLSSFPWRLSKAEEVEENNNVSDRVLNPQRSERRTQCCLLRREWIGVPLKKPSRLLEHTV